jgi:hypothetical protein
MEGDGTAAVASVWQLTTTLKSSTMQGTPSVLDDTNRSGIAAVLPSIDSQPEPEPASDMGMSHSLAALALCPMQSWTIPYRLGVIELLTSHTQ